MAPQISFLIVSFNTKNLLEQCIASIYKSLPEKNIEIIVIDNASDDGSVEMVSQTFPNVILIPNSENEGFGKANNAAYEKSTGEYIFLLNPDTVINEETVPQMVELLQNHHNQAVVGPRLVNTDGTIQASCFQLPTITGAIAEYIFGKKDAYGKYHPNTTSVTKVEAVVGAAMLMPRQVIEKLGVLFDESFYFYYEDIDLCRRLARQQVPIYYLPTATVVHHHGASTAKRGEWAGEQNKKSAKIYFGPFQFMLLTMILKYGQKWQKLCRIVTR